MMYNPTMSHGYTAESFSLSPGDDIDIVEEFPITHQHMTIQGCIMSFQTTKHSEGNRVANRMRILLTDDLHKGQIRHVPLPNVRVRIDDYGKLVALVPRHINFLNYEDTFKMQISPSATIPFLPDFTTFS